MHRACFEAATGFEECEPWMELVLEAGVIDACIDAWSLVGDAVDRLQDAARASQPRTKRLMTIGWWASTRLVPWTPKSFSHLDCLRSIVNHWNKHRIIQGQHKMIPPPMATTRRPSSMASKMRWTSLTGLQMFVVEGSAPRHGHR